MCSMSSSQSKQEPKILVYNVSGCNNKYYRAHLDTCKRRGQKLLEEYNPSKVYDLQVFPCRWCRPDIPYPSPLRPPNNPPSAVFPKRLTQWVGKEPEKAVITRLKEKNPTLYEVYRRANFLQKPILLKQFKEYQPPKPQRIGRVLVSKLEDELRRDNKQLYSIYESSTDEELRRLILEQHKDSVSGHKATKGHISWIPDDR